MISDAINCFHKLLMRLIPFIRGEFIPVYTKAGNWSSITEKLMVFVSELHTNLLKLCSDHWVALGSHHANQFSLSSIRKKYPDVTFPGAMWDRAVATSFPARKRRWPVWSVHVRVLVLAYVYHRATSTMAASQKRPIGLLITIKCELETWERCKR